MAQNFQLAGRFHSAAAAALHCQKTGAALKLLANPERLLLCQLAQQLGTLHSQRVVATHQKSKSIYCSVADTNILEILEVLYRLYCSKE
jgi:hypothetical protein